MIFFSGLEKFKTLFSGGEAFAPPVRVEEKGERRCGRHIVRFLPRGEEEEGLAV